MGAKTIEMLKAAYKDDAKGKTQIVERFSRFKKGEMSINDQPRSRCSLMSLSDESVEKICKIQTKFVLPGQKDNQTFYQEVLKRLSNSMR